MELEKEKGLREVIAPHQLAQRGALPLALGSGHPALSDKDLPRSIGVPLRHMKPQRHGTHDILQAIREARRTGKLLLFTVEEQLLNRAAEQDRQQEGGTHLFPGLHPSIELVEIAP